MIKKVLVLASFAVLAASCSQTSSIAAPEQNLPPKEVRDAMHEQALAVAFNRLMEDDISYAFDSLRVPQWAVDSIAKAMGNVWLSTSKERDSVIDVYKLTPHCMLDFHTFTGGLIDTSKYASLLKPFSIYLLGDPNPGLFDYRTDSDWNTQAVAMVVSQGLADEDRVSFNARTYGGDGDRIDAWFETDGIKLEYRLGYGDCYGGCIHRRYWTFKVSNEGLVTFLGVRGDPPCDPATRK